MVLREWMIFIFLLKTWKIYFCVNITRFPVVLQNHKVFSRAEIVICRMASDHISFCMDYTCAIKNQGRIQNEEKYDKSEVLHDRIPLDKMPQMAAGWR